MKVSARQIAIAVAMLLMVVFISAPLTAAAKSASRSVTSTTGKTSGKKLPPPPAPAPPSAIMHFCSNDPYPTTTCDPVNNAFDVNAVRDITILVSWQNVSGAHIQKLLFFGPNGDPYQAMTTAFDTTTGQAIQLLNDLPTVSNVLPVAGTWIQQRAIVGAWTVQLYLDDVLISQSTLNFY